MKSCPECKRTFEDTLTYCLIDGSILSAPFDPQATLNLPPGKGDPPTFDPAAERRTVMPPETIAAPKPDLPAAPPFVSESTQATPERKPNRTWWILGGLGLLLILGGVVAFFVINGMSNKQWEDTESNRAADRQNGVAARVNGKAIMRSEVDAMLAKQVAEAKTQLSPLEEQQARLQVLEAFIDAEVLFQRAEKEKLMPSDEEVTAAVEKQKKESGMSEAQFQAELKKQNLTLEALREAARRNLAIEALQNKWAANITVSDKEVEDYYRNNQSHFISERGVSLAVIVVDPEDNSSQGIINDDAKSDAVAKAKIDEIYQELKQGVDFATVARAKSEDKESLLQGGKIGFFTEDGMSKAGLPNDLRARFMGPMVVGDITEPKLVNNRWYIFKLLDRRLQSEKLTLESAGVREEIKKALVNEKTQIANAQLLATAKNEAKVVNYLAARNS